MSAGASRKVLFSAMKNEAPFVLEWIAYHKAIGFDEIVICSNPSNDGMEEILAALARAGEITHLRAEASTESSPQSLAAARFDQEVGFRDGDWYLWLDADEFLNVHAGDRTVNALIAAMADRSCALLNWRIFGSNGNPGFTGRFVSPAFCRAAGADFTGNDQIKSFFRKSAAYRGFSRIGVHRPLLVRGGKLPIDEVITGNGKSPSASVRGHARWLKGTEVGGIARVPADEAGWMLAQINHYLVRTPEHFALKRLRGRGSVPDAVSERNSRHTAAFFQKYDRNEEEDRSILVWQDRVTAEMERMAGSPEVSAALDRSAALVDSLLTGLLPGAPTEVATEVAAEVAAGRSARTSPRKVLFSAMKNEAPFVLEWIAYHKAIGFDEIVICSNPSNDGMEEILAALADAGEIRHLRTEVPPDERPQLVASDTFSDQVGFRPNDWYIWLDADEFLNIHAGDRTVQALVDAMAGKQFALINWRVFGAAGNDRFPGRFIDDRFARASKPDFRENLQQKTLFRFDDRVHGFGRIGIHRPQLVPTSGLAVDAVMVGAGTAADPSARPNRIWLRGSDMAANASVSVAERGWALAQINHYAVRTPEFFALKRLRGRGFEPGAAGRSNTRHTNWFFARNDRNETEDRSILHWQARVTDGIARLMRLPRVAEAKQHSDSLVQKILSEIGTAPDFAWLRIPAAAPSHPDPNAAPAPAPEFPLTFRPRETGLISRWYAKASVILEYGCGASTILAAELGKKVVSVESDQDRARRLAQHLRAFLDVTVLPVDIGPTEESGAPSQPRFHTRFHHYPLAVWDHPGLGDPDVVLIDGRFRLACMMAVLLRASRPTTVLFHDYIGQTDYHRVEQFARKEETVGRFARFTVTPGAIPPERLTDVIGWFSDPR
jgi:Glycosyl transferase family 2